MNKDVCAGKLLKAIPPSISDSILYRFPLLGKYIMFDSVMFISIVGGEDIVMTSTSKNKEAAWTFISSAIIL